MLARKGQRDRQQRQSLEVPDDLVHEHVAAGQLSKATAALLSDPPVEVTDAVVAEMKTKHPAARTGEDSRQMDLRPVDAASAVQVGVEDVLRALRSFPKGSAAGNSGLRPQHILDALCCGSQHETLCQITSVVNTFLKGQNPSRREAMAMWSEVGRFA